MTSALALARARTADSCSCSVIDWDLNRLVRAALLRLGVLEPGLGHLERGLALVHLVQGSLIDPDEDTAASTCLLRRSDPDTSPGWQQQRGGIERINVDGA